MWLEGMVLQLPSFPKCSLFFRPRRVTADINSTSRETMMARALTLELFAQCERASPCRYYRSTYGKELLPTPPSSHSRNPGSMSLCWSGLGRRILLDMDIAIHPLLSFIRYLPTWYLSHSDCSTVCVDTLINRALRRRL